MAAEEDGAGMQLVGIGDDIRPYMFEPEDSGSEDENREEEVDRDRLQGTDWCRCGNCIVMPTVRECRCGHEIEEVTSVMADQEVHCITVHPGFDAVCLNPWVLQTAYFQYRQQYGRNAQQKSLNEKYRHTSYRQLVRMCWQYLGRDFRVVLPACAVKKIREAFPSLHYEGFRLPPLEH